MDSINNLKCEIDSYIHKLKEEERSPSTVKQYAREIRAFFDFIETGRMAAETEMQRDFTKKDVIDYKEMLKSRFRPATVNVKIAAVNSFFTFAGRPELRVKQVRIQKRAYCDKCSELTKAEYERLIEAARRRGDERLALIIQTICATGIRVSELSYITADAVRRGEAVVELKGKIRVVLISGKLRKALTRYMKKTGIGEGAVFVTRSGKALDRSNIWKMMKGLCEEAGVSSEKVFPHNLRKLFARCFYRKCRDIAKLADVLGHSSIDTTRIYIVSTGTEHRKNLDALELVV